jgi:nucleoside-diphosphate-sugar epimerase
MIRQLLPRSGALQKVQPPKVQPVRARPFLQLAKASAAHHDADVPEAKGEAWPFHRSVAPSRRELFLGTAAAAALGMAPALPAKAALSTVVVAGATGQTGRRILEKLAGKGSLSVIAGVRDVNKATQTLNEASVTVRGAMVQKVPSVDTSAVTLAGLDVENDSVDSLAEVLKGAQALVIAVGFVPGNPFKMSAAANAVDNKGTVKLIDAAKAAGVSKVVMVSSILSDAGAWGQRESAGFKITNAFGNVLDEKLVAEQYLRNSGLEWTIVRPGGLKAQPPAGKLQVFPENTLNSGEVSRDLVADVCIDALTDPDVKNKVVEIIEEGTLSTVVDPAMMLDYKR